jgi:hypothetical protein
MLNKVVIHPRHGRGIVKQVRNGGARLYVQYKGQAGLFLTRIDEVEFEDINPSKSQKIRDHKKEKELTPRRLIESFRHGIVPKDCIENFTFGREIETKKLIHWLRDPNQSGLLLIGGYGSGKTHLLNYIKHVALKERFAVSLTEVNPFESPFSKPKRVYAKIAKNIRFKDKNSNLSGFEGLLKKIFHSGLLRNHFYFRHVHENLNSSLAWQWIQAKEDLARPYSEDNRFSNFPGIYGHHGNTANIFCNLLSSLGWAIQQNSVDLDGMLLIFDEAESLSSNITPTYHYRSNIFLNALLATARNRPDLLERPSCKTDFDYCRDADNIPFLYKNPSGLKIILAFTDDVIFDNSPELSCLPKLILNPLDELASNKVFNEISELYSKVYGKDSESLKIDTIREYLVNDVREMLTYDQGSTRLLVKSFVEALDIMRFHPEADPFEVLQYD